MKKHFTKLVLTSIAASLGIAVSGPISVSFMAKPEVVLAEGNGLGREGWIVNIVSWCISAAFGAATIGMDATDDTGKQLEIIIETLNEINSKVDDINNKMSAMASTLDTMLAEIDCEFSEMKIRDDINAIRYFNKTIFEDYQDQLDVAINKMFLNFSNYSSYQHAKDVYKIDKAYVLQIGNMTGEYICLDSSDVEDAINASQIPYSLEKQKEWIKEVSKNLLNTYKEDPEVQDTLLKRRNYGFTDDTFVDAFANGFYHYLRDDFKKIIFSGGELADYVANLITDYKTYCRQLSDPVDSPLIRQYDIFQNLFCFQQDTYYINSHGERRNLSVDIAYAYLLNLVRFAKFTFEVANLSGSVTQTKLDELTNDLLTTSKHIIDLMNGFYKVDENGNPYDNYCYATKCPVTIGNNYLTSDGETFMTVEIRDNKIDMEGDESGYHMASLLINEDQNNKIRLDENKFAYLSIMSNNMPVLIGNTRPTFHEHLNSVFKDELQDSIYLSSKQASDFTLSSGYLMNSYAFAQNENNDVYHNAPQELIDKNQIYVNKTGYNNVDALQNKYFPYHQEIVGDYFDLNTNKVVKDASLYSAALYYEPNKNYDDIGFFSAAQIMGMENTADVNTTDLWGGTKGGVPFKDSVATMTIVSQQDFEGGEKESKYVVDYNYNLQSINLITNAKYGKLKLGNSPFELGFSNQDYENINKAIDRANVGLEDKIPYYGRNSNESPFWLGYDLSATPEEATRYKEYLYNHFLEPGNEKNLIETYKNYEEFAATALDQYGDIIENPYKDTLYTEIDLPEDRLTYTVNTILSILNVMKEFGLDTKDFKMPGEDARDFTILTTIKPQLSRRFIIDEYDNNVYSPYGYGFVLMPALAYTENGVEQIFELPSSMSPFIETNDIKINLPVTPYDSDSSVRFGYDTNVAVYGLNQIDLIDTLKSKNGVDYVSFSVPTLGSYSIMKYLKVVPGEYKIVEGKDPTCIENGYKDAFMDQEGKYYSEPGTLIGDGSLGSYLAWTIDPDGGCIPASGQHSYTVVENYEFDEATKTFEITLKCSKCGKVKGSPIIVENATFVIDEPANCEHSNKGHYICVCPTNDEKIIVKTESIYYMGEIGDHELLHVNAVPATCERAGVIEHYKCRVCGKNFDVTTLEPLDNVIVSPINHINKDPYVANEPTLSAPGNKEYWKCPDCGQYYLDEDCTIKVSPQEVVIPQLSFEYVKVNQLLPTHYTNGHKTYYYCPQDGKYYYDKQGVDEIEDFESWIGKDGEGFMEKEPCEFDGPISYTMNGDQCTASRPCTYPGCKEIEQETVTADFVVDTPATCTSNAKGHYVAEFRNEDFDVYTTPANSVELAGSALGHSFNEVTCSWDGKTCTAVGVCEHCHKTVSLSKEGTIVIDTLATCTADATGHYEAVFNVAGIGKQSSQTFTIENSFLGHRYENGECIRCHQQDPNQTLQENNKGIINGLIVACSLGGAALVSTIGLSIALFVSKKKKKII